jgi:hypothetical protein
MNPYTAQNTETLRLVNQFHNKYFNDTLPRKLILGINPGRHGAGLTGLPFTDSPALRNHCQIETTLETKETSADFVYQVIDAYGGPKSFYKKWFIGGVCPLGFLTLNAKGNWVNWNYYDQAELQKSVEPFIVEQLKKQVALCGMPQECVIFGTGKNFKYLSQLNKKLELFTKITPLEHPRYVMQYKLKSKQLYIDKFLTALAR